MIVDDFIMRQIRQIAELVARLADSDRGSDEAEERDVDDAIAEGYRALLALDPALASALAAPSLVAMLAEPALREPLAQLLLAHGDVERRRGDEAGAQRRWRKGLAVLEGAA